MIYIQSNPHKTLPHHFDCACALYGAMDSSENYKLITFEEIEQFKSLIKTNLFVGSVEFMKGVFNQIGLSDVGLPRNSNRSSKIISLGEAIEKNKQGERIFIKPVDIKLFTGFVMEGYNYTCLKDLPMDTKLRSYKPFSQTILSEWRIYIHKGEIEDARQYYGELLLTPDIDYINKVLCQNYDMSGAYTIDIAILKDGTNVVVEFNDMWAIGNYGVPNDIYVDMLKSRYFEIVKQKVA